MTSLPTITLSGEVIPLPVIMTFDVLERAWPALRARVATTDVIEQHAAAIAFASAVLRESRPDLTVPEIKKRLRISLIDGVNERAILLRAVDDLCVASGLVPVGEANPPETPAEPTTT